MIALSESKLKQEEKFVYYETDFSVSFTSGKSILDYCDCSNSQNILAVDSFFKNKSAYLSEGLSLESKFSLTVAQIPLDTSLPESVLNIILDGELEFTLSDKNHRCHQGSAVFIPANTKHSLRMFRDVKILEIWCNG